MPLRIFGLALLSIWPALGCNCLNPVKRVCTGINAEVALVGRVIQVEDSGVKEHQNATINSLRVRLEVIESLRGAREERDKQILIFTSPTSCGYRFVPGEEYLVFAQRGSNGQELLTGVCSGNRHVSEMKEVLDQVRAYVKQEGPVSIYGFATLNPGDITWPFRASKPVAGAPILLRNDEREWRTVTDSKGNYEFDNLPPGEFELHASLDGPKAQRQIKLNAGACSEQNFLGARR